MKLDCTNCAVFSCDIPNISLKWTKKLKCTMHHSYQRIAGSGDMKRKFLKRIMGIRLLTSTRICNSFIALSTEFNLTSMIRMRAVLIYIIFLVYQVPLSTIGPMSHG
uniref:Uncharacterized protein n=1 Tax=Physcomitrium patens TaxID=3218 RepID=A0A2K1L799_PHYPA|nr:hypothetical protein PHYPA_000339 [Physcomitrium patens]